MRVLQTKHFERRVKKLSPGHKAILDAQVRSIMDDPSIGDQKKGDLHGVFVHKFYINKTLYLLAYRHTDDLLELIMLGSHQNYYKQLKNYLK